MPTTSLAGLERFCTHVTGTALAGWSRLWLPRAARSRILANFDGRLRGPARYPSYYKEWANMDALYDNGGHAIAYVDADGTSIYLFDGSAVGWIDQVDVYAYSGRYLGWI